MDGKGKRSGLAVALAILGMVAFIGFICWAIIGLYLEVQTSKRISRERMDRVKRQIEDREAAEAAR